MEIEVLLANARGACPGTLRVEGNAPMAPPKLTCVAHERTFDVTRAHMQRYADGVSARDASHAAALQPRGFRAALQTGARRGGHMEVVHDRT